MSTMASQDLLLSQDLSSEHLKQQADDLLCRIVRANYNTQFAQAAPALAKFREAMVNAIDGTDDASLANTFRETVQFTAYDTYEPFVAKFFEEPCKTSSVTDLLAPGLPDYVVGSSSTSGARGKFFPRYHSLSALVSLDTKGRCSISGPSQKRTKAWIKSLLTDQIDVEDDQNCLFKKVYLSSSSAVLARAVLNLNPEYDGENMGAFILDCAAPYATAFIKKWRSFLLIHAIFTLSSISIETISVIFMSTFVDMMRYLDTEFSMVVDCIERGTIPCLDGVEEVWHHLEQHLLPDPERAEELRCLGPPSSRPGWCGLVWPSLRLVEGISSGIFASYIPLARWYLGPSTQIRSKTYGCSEAAVIGLSYNPCELNLYKLTNIHLVEFLDIEKSRDLMSSLSQPWEVKVGKRYEIVITTSNGLWRYRLEDVIEIIGFDPIDGVPVMKFIERRNVIITITQITFSEDDLKIVISPVFPANIVSWTATIDDRQLPTTIGFFIELAQEVSDLDFAMALDRVWDAFIRLKPSIPYCVQVGWMRKATIRLVRSGTFNDFRQLKLDEGSVNIGQIKVPVVLPKAEYVVWFSDRVVHEL